MVYTYIYNKSWIVLRIWNYDYVPRRQGNCTLNLEHHHCQPKFLVGLWFEDCRNLTKIYLVKVGWLILFNDISHCLFLLSNLGDAVVDK